MIEEDQPRIVRDLYVFTIILIMCAVFFQRLAGFISLASC
jgi:hypothetical protein